MPAYFSKDSSSDIPASTKRVFGHALYDSMQYACDGGYVQAYHP